MKATIKKQILKISLGIIAGMLTMAANSNVTPDYDLVILNGRVMDP